MSGLMPGAAGARVESGNLVIADHSDAIVANAEDALVNTVLTEADVSVGKPSSVSRERQYQPAAAGNPMVHTVLTASQDRSDRSYVVSADIFPVAYAVADRSIPSSRVGQGSQASGNGIPVAGVKKDESFQMPYPLVLALFALIGLVPVSRRHR